MDDRTPNLTDLTHVLEMRWRLLLLLDITVSALSISAGASLVVLLANGAFELELPIGRIVLMMNGGALLASIVIIALRRRESWRFLVDADRTYGLKSLLVSGYQLAGRTDADEPRSRLDASRAGFERLVVEKAEASTDDIDPHQVYPSRTPRRVGVLAAIAVALGILLILDASGWFDPPVAPYAEQALLLEDAGRRLAERAEENDELQALADEMLRLGEQVRRNELDADTARRRIEELAERVEDQMSNIKRTAPFEQNEDAQIPEDAEDTVRRALQSGMGESEVVELFTRMRAEGNTVPDVIEALEEATPDRAPDTNLGIDPERMRELMDQLNRPPPADEDAQTDLTRELEQSQRALQQAGSGLSRLDEGDNREPGQAEGEGVGVGRGRQGEEPSTGENGEQPGGDQAPGQQGGTGAVDDTGDDDFRSPEDSSPVFREIQGIVTDNTIMDIIIRELPSEATSGLSEQEREVAFERIVEEAVTREDTPRELQRLVRNYFLRLTMANEEGAEDEQ